MKIEFEVKTGTEAFLVMEAMKQHLNVASCQIIVEQLEAHLNELWSGQATQAVVNEVLEDALIERLANIPAAMLGLKKNKRFDPNKEARLNRDLIQNRELLTVNEAIEIEKKVQRIDLSKVDPSPADTLPRVPDFWEIVDKASAEFYASKATVANTLEAIIHMRLADHDHPGLAGSSIFAAHTGEENVSTK